MSHDLQRTAIARSIAARLPLASLDEIRLLDVALETIEAIRHGDGRTWMRRVATGPGDVDTSFHATRPLRALMATACGGSWPIEDAAEASPNPPLEERCHACWRAAAARSPGGPALGETLLVLVAEMAERDRERAGLREAARDEMLPPATIGEQLTAFGEEMAGVRREHRRDLERMERVTIGLPGDDLGPVTIPVEPDTGPIAAAAQFTEERATVIGGPEPYDDIKLEWDVEDKRAGSGT
jgi:hypothetical protein